MSKVQTGAEFKMSLEGDRALLRTLKSLEKKIARKVCRKAARAAAKIAQRELKTAIPIGPKKKGHKPGNLRRSIKVRATKKSRRWVGAVVQISRRDKDADGFYAPFLEFGTGFAKTWKKKPIENPKTGIRIVARHWQEKSFKQNEAPMRREFEKVFYLELEKEANAARRENSSGKA